MNQATKKEAAALSNPLGFAKKILFTVILILISLLILVLLEGLLELLNYGGDLDLVLEKEINGVEYCYINKQVARRYFSSRDVTISSHHRRLIWFFSSTPSGP